jgi:hypothetical protein
MSSRCRSHRYEFVERGRGSGGRGRCGWWVCLCWWVGGLGTGGGVLVLFARGRRRRVYAWRVW